MTIREDSGQTRLVKIKDKGTAEKARVAFAQGHRLGLRTHLFENMNRLTSD